MTVPGNVAGSNGLGVADVPSLSKATAKAADDSGAGGSGSGSPELAIDVAHLTFAFPSHDPALVDLTLALPRGARCVLVGANGAGKSTLLQVLAGKRLTPSGARVNIRGRDVFRRASAGVTFLGTEWAMNPVVRGDIKVSEFLDSVGGYRHAERRNRLLDLLDVDLDWHMHAISDGERRRVQLVMGLMAPWDVLLLDEVTVDLDVLVRDELLAYLKEESESRSATVLCMRFTCIYARSQLTKMPLQTQPTSLTDLKHSLRILRTCASARLSRNLCTGSRLPRLQQAHLLYTRPPCAGSRRTESTAAHSRLRARSCVVLAGIRRSPLTQRHSSASEYLHD